MRLQAVALRLAVATLPTSQRQAPLLAKLQERALREAAEISGMTVGALNIATHRAAAALRGRLRGSDGDQEFIDRRSAQAAPVRRLGPPWQGLFYGSVWRSR